MLKISIYICLMGLLVGSGILTQNSEEKYYFNRVAGELGYTINDYTQKYELDEDLQEISGLSYYKKHQLACVEDEHGDLYIYDLRDKKIVEVVDFGKKGDYEGVEIVGKEVFVLESDGTIHNFSMRDVPDVETVSWKTPLSSKDDVEGLGYVAKNKQLLLACKEKSKFDDQKSDGRAIYLFDPKQKKLIPRPFVDIEDDDLNDFLRSETKEFEKIKKFKPSGVAVHPITQQTFIIASVGELLVVVDKNGALEHVIPLDDDLFEQPEGICFAPDGTLYIASEGGKDEGYILEFAYR